jgi:hypothetical protein
MKCIYCKKKISTVLALNHHIKKSKYCIKKQLEILQLKNIKKNIQMVSIIN